MSCLQPHRYAFQSCDTILFLWQWSNDQRLACGSLKDLTAIAGILATAAVEASRLAFAVDASYRGGESDELVKSSLGTAVIIARY